MEIKQLTTERLIIKPFTIEFCQSILNNDFSQLGDYKRGKSWPDQDVLETLPKIINQLDKVKAPTGFESWLIIKKDTYEIIGDLGFKGFNLEAENIDLGYGIIVEERRKGYAAEAVKEIINWAFSNGKVKEITANCLSANSNSIKLLAKFNFIKQTVSAEMIYWKLENRNYKSKVQK